MVCTEQPTICVMGFGDSLRAPGEDDVGTLDTEGVRGAASGLQLPTLTRRHLPSPLAPSRRSPPASSPSLVHLAWWQMA